MNEQDKIEFANAFKTELERTNDFGILCAELKTILGHGHGYVIEKMTLEPRDPRPAYVLTVNFKDSVTDEHERIKFYAHFPLTIGIKPYQNLTPEPYSYKDPYGRKEKDFTPKT